MKNENILIFGDSYSTYAGHVPAGYAVYYPHEGIETVDSVEKTWWHMLASETGSLLLLNNSWSGSTICNTGYQGDCSKTSSFIFRLQQLIEGGFFAQNRVDRVLVFGGTNDSWSGNTCGTVQYEGWSEADLRLILPGICYFAHLLMQAVPKEKIHFIINTDLRPEVKEGFLALCAHNGIGHTVLREIDKIGGHPTYAGMCAIKEQTLADLFLS